MFWRTVAVAMAGEPLLPVQLAPIIDVNVGAAWNVAEVVETPVAYPVTVVVPAGENAAMHCTSQSPAVRDTLETFDATPLLSETFVRFVGEGNSPILPELALSAAVVPTIPAVLEGVIVLFALIVVASTGRRVVLPKPPAGGLANSPSTNAVVASCVVFVLVAAVGAAGVPVKVGDASSAYEAAAVPPSDDALIAVLQVKPVLVVYVSALELVEHDGIAKAVGLALDPVTFATTVLAACDARLASPTFPVAVNVPLTVRLLNVGDG